MAMGKILEKMKKPKQEEEASEEFVELDESAMNQENKVGVRIETLKDFLDTERVQNLLREGNVVFLRVKNLRNKDMAELKRSVEKLKKTCTAMNGDIAGIDEDFLVLTPKFAKVYRGQ